MKHLKTEKDFEAEIRRISSQVAKLESMKTKLENRKREKFDEEYRRERNSLRDYRKQVAAMVEEANRKFVGKWLFIDDGTYIHVTGVGRPDDSDSRVTEIPKCLVTFPTYYDIMIAIKDSEYSLYMQPGELRRCLYFTLYAADTIKATKKAVMSDLAQKVSEINADYAKLCRKFRWTIKPGAKK